MIDDTDPSTTFDLMVALSVASASAIVDQRVVNRIIMAAICHV